MNKKILFIGPTARSIHTFRIDLIREMQKLNYEVHVACESDDFTAELSDAGIVIHDIKMSRFMSPIHDMSYLFSLVRLMASCKYDIIHSFTIKPNFYGSIANLMTGKRAKLVSLVEGFGFLYGYDNNIKTKLIRGLYFFLNRVAFLFATKVWFINKDDQQEMISRGVVARRKCVFIKSIGVNLDLYSSKNINQRKITEIKEKYEISSETIVISLISRMNKLKGIVELIEAGRMVQGVNDDIIILLIGEIQEGSPYTMTKEDFGELPSNVKWVGFTRDINEYNFLTSISCLPTYYREGVPRSLMEAMSFKKPLVVSDSVGCRELVIDGYNGYLVPIKDPISLSKILLKLSESQEDIKNFGENSFNICVDELDVNKVNQKVIKSLYEL